MKHRFKAGDKVQLKKNGHKYEIVWLVEHVDVANLSGLALTAAYYKLAHHPGDYAMKPLGENNLEVNGFGECYVYDNELYSNADILKKRLGVE